MITENETTEVLWVKWGGGRVIMQKNIKTTDGGGLTKKGRRGGWGGGMGFTQQGARRGEQRGGTIGQKGGGRSFRQNSLNERGVFAR